MFPAVAAAALTMLTGCLPMPPTHPVPTTTITPSPPRNVTGFAVVQQSPITQENWSERSQPNEVGEYSCDSRAGYEDIAEGAQVRLLTLGGEVIATSTLLAGVTNNMISNPTFGVPCIFEFTFPDVTLAEAEYSIQVGKPERPGFVLSNERVRMGPLIFVDGR